MFSIELVQASERRSFAGSFRRLTVRPGRARARSNVDKRLYNCGTFGRPLNQAEQITPIPAVEQKRSNECPHLATPFPELGKAEGSLLW